MHQCIPSGANAGHGDFLIEEAQMRVQSTKMKEADDHGPC